MATDQSMETSSSSSSVSVYDVLEDMEILRKYSHIGAGSKRKQTTLTSFLPNKAISESSCTSATQVSPSPPKYPRTATAASNSVSTSSNHDTVSKGLSYSQMNSHPKEVKRKQYVESQKCTSQNEESVMSSSGAGDDRPKKTCPFYKRVPGTGFTVDAFRYGCVPGCTGYFLSHFHADHYQGLTRRFEGTLYCSKVTANLVSQRIKVSPACIHPLSLNEGHVIRGVEVTLLEANHCPGAVLLLFKLRSGKAYLHTGDFRFCPTMMTYPQLHGLTIHELYLDTTYCDPKYDFPKQVEAISFAVEKSLQAVRKNPRTLIVCGTYTIGKEKVFQAIADALGCDVSVTKDKKTVLDCLESDWISQRVHTDKHSCGLHVLPIGKLTLNYLSSYLEQCGDEYDALVAFKPTGWTYSGGLSSVRPQTNGTISVYGVPYSEHSSFTELREFVQFLKPLKIIPTVDNSSAKRRDEMQQFFKEWLSGQSQASSVKQTTLFDSFGIR